MKLLGTLLSLVCATVCAQSTAPDPVRIAGGLVLGTREGAVVVYKGVPFAEPPVGDLRWRPPASGREWRGVLEALEYAGTHEGH